MATELVRWTIGRGAHTLPALGLAILEQLTKQAPAKSKQLCSLGESLKGRLKEAIGPAGVMIHPPLPVPAPFHDEGVLGVFNAAATAIFNVMELPVTQIPLGLDANGLPLGLQIVGDHCNDHLTIRVAVALEEGGLACWKPPCLS